LSEQDSHQPPSTAPPAIDATVAAKARSCMRRQAQGSARAPLDASITESTPGSSHLIASTVGGSLEGGPIDSPSDTGSDSDDGQSSFVDVPREGSGIAPIRGGLADGVALEIDDISVDVAKDVGTNVASANEQRSVFLDLQDIKGRNGQAETEGSSTALEPKGGSMPISHDDLGPAQVSQGMYPGRGLVLSEASSLGCDASEVSSTTGSDTETGPYDGEIARVHRDTSFDNVVGNTGYAIGDKITSPHNTPSNG